MQRRLDRQDRVALIIERVVWHAAAGAALAVMILVLLGSLRWLDEIAPRPRAAVSAAPAAVLGDAAAARGDAAAAPSHTRTAEAHPPSG